MNKNIEKIKEIVTRHHIEGYCYGGGEDTDLKHMISELSELLTRPRNSQSGGEDSCVYCNGTGIVNDNDGVGWECKCCKTTDVKGELAGSGSRWTTPREMA